MQASQTIPIEFKFTYLLISIVIMILIGFVIFIISIYTKKQQIFFQEKLLQEKQFENEILLKEIERQKAIQNERERISQDMHDDLGAGISAIKLHVEFLKSKVNDETFDRDFNDILQTSEDMNISMREILWSLEADNNKLGNFVEYAMNYAEYFFRKSPIKIESYRENLDLNVDLGNEKRRNLFLCFKESMHNIHKHSSADQIQILFKNENDHFLMKISDNGNGFTENHKKGNGLPNMTKRMHAIQGTLSIHQDPSGTELSFQVPL